MRAGGMLRVASARPRRAYLAPLPLLLLLVVLVDHANALPLQYLPEIPGYIPVYIRHGDQPLEEINPALAEAFHESSGIFKSIQDLRLDEPASENSNKDLTDGNEVSLDFKEDNETETNAKLSAPGKQLIYAIPQENIFEEKSKKESVVMKISKSTSLDKADVKKITKEIQLKEGNK